MFLCFSLSNIVSLEASHICFYIWKFIREPSKLENVSVQLLSSAGSSISVSPEPSEKENLDRNAFISHPG